MTPLLALLILLALLTAGFICALAWSLCRIVAEADREDDDMRRPE
jgi:hypothetical protein